MAKNTNSTAMAIGQQQRLDYLNEFANQATRSSNIVGKLLKFTKGEWLAGKEEEEIAEGTRVIVNVESILTGWTRWQSKRPMEQEMGVVMDGYQPKPRSELGFTDQSDWEPDDRGGVRDPWQQGSQALVKGVDGTIYTFTSASTGGGNALKALCKEAWRHSKETGKLEYPIVELGIDFYKHSQHGKIYIPLLTVVDWFDPSEFTLEEAPAKGRAKVPPKPTAKTAAAAKTKSGGRLTYK
jgi:hypothetical protein